VGNFLLFVPSVYILEETMVSIEKVLLFKQGILTVVYDGAGIGLSGSEKFITQI